MAYGIIRSLGLRNFLTARKLADAVLQVAKLLFLGVSLNIEYFCLNESGLIEIVEKRTIRKEKQSYKSQSCCSWEFR